MTSLTVAALAALTPGERLSAGNALYIRCNTDRTLTASLRVKREGRQIDLKVGAFVPPFSKATLARITKDTQAVRENADAHIERRAERSTPASDETEIGSRSTLGEVWTAYVAEVEANGRWSERNLKANKDRANAHFAGWKAWDRPAESLTAQDIKALIAPLRKSTPAQAKKLCGLLRLALTFAKVHKLKTSALLVDEALEELKVTGAKVATGRNHHALTDINELRALYRAVDGLSGSAYVRGALKFQALTAQRTGEVVNATWSEFDLDSKTPTWTIPRSRMKIKDATRPDHVLHLSPAAVALLKSLPKAGDFVFAGRSGFRDAVSDTAISQAMRRDLGMDGKMVPHGWRAAIKTLSTRATDKDGRPMFAPRWAEQVLDHQPEDSIEAAYDRGAHHEGAGRVLAWWAEQLTAQHN